MHAPLRHVVKGWLLITAAFLVGCGIAQSTVTATATTPTATVDSTTAAYLSMLQTFYVPWSRDHTQQRNQCGFGFNAHTPEQQARLLPDCRPVLDTEITAGKTLVAQLATAQPPTRWQAAHDALKHALQAIDTYDAQRLQAIDAHNVTQFVNLSGSAPQVMVLFCTPIHTINAGPPATAFSVPDPSSCS